MRNQQNKLSTEDLSRLYNFLHQEDAKLISIYSAFNYNVGGLTFESYLTSECIVIVTDIGQFNIPIFDIEKMSILDSQLYMDTKDGRHFTIGVSSEYRGLQGVYLVTDEEE